MKHDLRKIADAFQIAGDFAGGEPYGSGHINDTYAVRINQSGTLVRYIFQRINHSIFRAPLELMENVERVTLHLNERLLAEGAPDASRRALTLVPTQDGCSCHRDESGSYWRVYLFIEHARTFDELTSADQAREAAKAFGAFQLLLNDMPGPSLHETIPDFHNGLKRFEAFQKALREDVRNRAKDVKAEIEFMESHAWIFDVLPGLVSEGRIPVRVTHNDTKINNVMLDDATGEGLCVIDLDTVMPGLALYDFGDMVRTSTSPAAEDERDLSKVAMRMPMFEALVSGYLSRARDFLNREEVERLPFSGKMITLIIGTRFLTDHLAGDVYFKIKRENHNLDRARTQFRLVQLITEAEEEMNKVVSKYA